MESSFQHKRQKAEIAFHDNKFKKQSQSDYYSVGFTTPIFNNMMGLLGNLEGKKVLDFGCGEGWLCDILLRKGAKVWSFDISMEAVRKTKTRLLQKLFSSKDIHLIQSAAENLPFDSEVFDFIVGTAILHHLDLTESAQEIHRVLRKGGKAYFMEPLGHNPLLNWYRNKTPNLRSPNEEPLFFNDFKIYEKLFFNVQHEEYYLTVLFALFWHLIIKDYGLMLRTRDVLLKIDKIILHVLPFLKKYCWYTILEMQK